MTACGSNGSRLEVNIVTLAVLDHQGCSLGSSLSSELEEDVVLDAAADIRDTGEGSTRSKGVSTILNSLQQSIGVSNGGLGTLDGNGGIIVTILNGLTPADNKVRHHVVVDDGIDEVILIQSNILVAGLSDVAVLVLIEDLGLLINRNGQVLAAALSVEGNGVISRGLGNTLAGQIIRAVARNLASAQLGVIVGRGDVAILVDGVVAIITSLVLGTGLIGDLDRGDLADPTDFRISSSS